MRSETIALAGDLRALLEELGSAAARLRRADRAALARVRVVEKWLQKHAPRLEAWTQPLVQDHVKPPKGASTSAKLTIRTASLGFAPVEPTTRLEQWLASAELPVPRRWSVVVREEYRTEGGKAVLQRTLRLGDADVTLRLALAEQLGALLRAMLDEVRTRLERTPGEVAAPSSRRPARERKAKKAEAPSPEPVVPATPDPVPA